MEPGLQVVVALTVVVAMLWSFAPVWDAIFEVA